MKILFYFYIPGMSAPYENQALCAGIDHLHWPAVDSLPVFFSCTPRFPRTGPLYLHSPLSLLSTTRVHQKNVGEIESILQSYHNSSDFNRRSQRYGAWYCINVITGTFFDQTQEKHPILPVIPIKSQLFLCNYDGLTYREILWDDPRMFPWPAINNSMTQRR